MSSFCKLGFSIVVLMNRRARKFFAVPGLAVLALLASGAFSAAQVPYMQNFTPSSGTSTSGTTSGYVAFVGDPVYTLDVTSADGAPTGLTGPTWAGTDSIGGDYNGNGKPGNSNAYIAQIVGANGAPGTPNPPGITFSNSPGGGTLGIGPGVSGSGSWFLFGDTGTFTNSFAAQVWGTPSPSTLYSGTFDPITGGIPVTPLQTYTFSFWLTNHDTYSNSVAIIAPVINGLNLAGTGSPVGTGDGTLGGGVSANGYYSDGISGDQWQQFSYTWTAPAGTTTAVLGLYNLQATGSGNDFGIDNISLTATPEPSTLALLGTGGIGLLGFAWRKRTRFVTDACRIEDERAARCCGVSLFGCKPTRTNWFKS